MTSATLSAPPRAIARRVQTRFVLLAAGAATLLLTLLVMLQVWNAYGTTFSLFNTIAESSSAKVDAAEQALRYIADMDTNAATFVATAPDNPKHWQSLDAIHAGYQNYRDQMFAVRADLSSDEERQIYQRIEYFSFDQFWQHLGNLLTAQQNGDRATAVSEYIIADNYLQNQIARYLLDLEALNFNAMQQTQQSAASIIAAQVLLLAILVIGLALALTGLSFWLRGKVRRFLTPGIDAATILAWLLAILMLIELGQAPGQLQRMVQDAYYGVTASARVLAVANQANSMQSGSVIDPTNAVYWQGNFDTYKNAVELRLCGQAGCLANSFLSASDTLNPNIVAAAKQISQANLSALGVQPMVTNTMFPGQAAALENARLALNDYLKIDSQVRGLLKANNVDDAAALSTGSDAGQSGEAFTRFSQAIEQARQINRNVFDDVSKSVRGGLSLHQILFGLLGYGVLIVLLLVGVVHRFREL